MCGTASAGGQSIPIAATNGTNAIRAPANDSETNWKLSTLRDIR